MYVKGRVPRLVFMHISRECGSTFYVGMLQKQNSHPVQCDYPRAHTCMATDDKFNYAQHSHVVTCSLNSVQNCSYEGVCVTGASSSLSIRYV